MIDDNFKPNAQLRIRYVLRYATGHSCKTCQRLRSLPRDSRKMEKYYIKRGPKEACAQFCTSSIQGDMKFPALAALFFLAAIFSIDFGITNGCKPPPPALHILYQHGSRFRRGENWLEFEFCLKKQKPVQSLFDILTTSGRGQNSHNIQ